MLIATIICISKIEEKDRACRDLWPSTVLTLYTSVQLAIDGLLLVPTALLTLMALSLCV